MQKPNVLVADTSVFMRTLLKTHLEALNFEVAAIARDQKECLAKCLELKPDIVLVDIAIAEADNFALIRLVREATPSSSVIVMIPEQLSFPEVVVEAVKAGAAGYISKPVSPVELKSRLRGVLERQRTDGDYGQ